MINLFNKKQEQEKKKALSLDDISFIAKNTQDINLKDKAGEILVNENAKNNDFYNLQCIMSNNNYSLKTQISAGEKYIESLSLKPFHEQKELIDISGCKGHIKENREKAGIKFIDNCVPQGYYSKLSKISKNENYPLEVREYAKNNFNLAIENKISYDINQGDFDSLLSLEKDREIPTNLQDRARESVRDALDVRLKESYEKEIPNYFFEISKQENISESIKDWLKKEGTKIAIKNVETFYAHNNYSNLKNYSYWTWVPQEVQELSKKKLEELVVEMGKRL